MTKKRKSWLCFIRSFFFPESTHNNNKQQLKINNRRRWLFGRLRKNKGRLPPIPPSSIEDVIAENKVSKCEEEFVPKCEVDVTKSLNDIHEDHENRVYVVAVIKIQAYYRGYLARKALKALKGFVILQAIIRGRAVRRQAITTLKCLQAVVNIQAQVCTKRNQIINYHNNPHQDLRDDHKSKVDVNKPMRVDDALLTKEEEIDIILRKKEAIMRRHRSRAYSFNHRSSTDSEDGKVEGRLRHWLKHYANEHDNKLEAKHPKSRNIEGLNNPQALSIPRRSFHKYRKQNSYIEDGLHPSSPSSIPTYMAATESTKAKTRSTSSPRLRPMYFEAYSDGDSPYKHKLISPMSSINSELTCMSKVSSKSFASLQQNSPSFKGIPSHVVSSWNLKNGNLDSQGLLINKGSK